MRFRSRAKRVEGELDILRRELRQSEVIHTPIDIWGFRSFGYSLSLTRDPLGEIEGEKLLSHRVKRLERALRLVMRHFDLYAEDLPAKTVLVKEKKKNANK